MKLNKTQQRQVREFMELQEGYCVSVSDWVNGSGRFVSKKAYPPFVKRVEKKEVDRMSGTELRGYHLMALEYFRKHPKRKAVLVIDQQEVNLNVDDSDLALFKA